ncbi:MAG: hypothetical protein U0559_06190 [Anaerolineae bacterium]
MFFSFGKHFKLTFIEPHSLLLEHQRWSALLDLLGLCGVGVLLGLVVVNSQVSNPVDWLGQRATEVIRNPIAVLLLMVAVGVLAQSVIRNLRVLLKGSRVLFDASTHHVFVNERQVAAFRDVTRVRVTKVKGRHSWYYELCVDLKNARWLEIDTHGWPADYVAAANAIAAVVRARVEQDER